VSKKAVSIGSARKKNCSLGSFW